MMLANKIYRAMAPQIKTITRQSQLFSTSSSKAPEWFDQFQFSKDTVVPQEKSHGQTELYEFMLKKMNTISDLKLRFRRETFEKFGNYSLMLSAPDQCEHMKFLLQVANAKKGIEVGVFTGYSALCLAEALPHDGKLVAIDISEEFASLGKKYWKEAGQEKKIDLQIGDANVILDNMITQKDNLKFFDFAYIDADKPNYIEYFKRCKKLVKKGGIIILDNILFFGLVNKPEKWNENEFNMCGKAAFETNQFVLNDPDVESHTIMMSDGIMFAKLKQ